MFRFTKFVTPGLLALALLALALPILPLAARAADEGPRVGIVVLPASFREDRAAVRVRLLRSGASLPALTVQLLSTDARAVVPPRFVDHAVACALEPRRLNHNYL